MKSILFILWFCISLFANEKHLKNQIKAEVHAQNLVEGGYYKKAATFLEKARLKYPKSETLWSFSGKTYYELKSFDKAKNFYIKTLEINPKNEQAARFKGRIEKQEKASENKAVEKLFDYLNDKGMDFLLIFLAFLGGEIIARKYTKCSTLEERNLPLQYARRTLLQESFLNRLVFALKNYIDIKKIFSFCSFFNLTVILLISFSLLVIFLLFSLVLDLSLGSLVEVKYMSVKQLWQYSLNIFVVTTVISISIGFINYLRYLKLSSLKLELEMVQYMQNLSSNDRLDKLYEFINECDRLNIKKEEILHTLLGDEVKEQINYIYKKIEN